jgi:uncharacterized membrane protein
VHCGAPAKGKCDGSGFEIEIVEMFIEFFITLALGIVAAGALYGMRAFLETRRAISIRAFALSTRAAERILCGMVALYISVFSTLTVLRYLSFNIGYLDDYTSWDLGQYDQIIWNSLQGRLFENSFFPDAPNFLGKSFTPILLALTPLYALLPSPIVLLVLQTVALALGAFPLYWYARARLGNGLALILALAYLLSPALQNTNVAEFHEVALVTPFLAYTTFFLLRRHYRGFLVSLGLTLLIKEEIAFIAVMFGIYIFLFQRKRLLGAGLALFGMGWSVLLLQYLIPYFRTDVWGGTFYYFESGSLAGGGGRYGYLGKTLPEIITTILTRPDIIAAEVLIPSKIAYVLHLLVPLALLPLIGFEVSAVALPTFGYTLLSRYAHQHSLAAAYHAPILPFLFFGAVVGLERMLKWKQPFLPMQSSALGLLILITSVSSYSLEAPGPLARKFQPNRYVLNEHTDIGHRLLNLVSADAGIVAAQNELLTYVTQRRFVYEVSVKNYRQFDYLVFDKTRGWYRVHESFWEPYLVSGYFDILAEEDGWGVAKRRVPSTPVQISFDGKMTLLAYTLVPENAWRGGETLRPIVGWRADATIPERYIVHVDLVDQDGHIWKSDAREPQEGALPTNRWDSGQYVQDQYWLHIDHTAPSGDYRIIVRVFDPARQVFLSAVDANGNAHGDAITLTTVPIQKSKASVTASQIEIEHRLVATMGEIRFLGYTLPRQTLDLDKPFSIGLYWRALSKPRGDYIIAVQLRDANGRIAFERTGRPAKGTCPTTQWDAGEILLDWHDFDLPHELAAGEYQIVVVLQDSASRQILGATTIATVTRDRR